MPPNFNDNHTRMLIARNSKLFEYGFPHLNLIHTIKGRYIGNGFFVNNQIIMMTGNNLVKIYENGEEKSCKRIKQKDYESTNFSDHYMPVNSNTILFSSWDKVFLYNVEDGSCKDFIYNNRVNYFYKYDGKVIIIGTGYSYDYTEIAFIVIDEKGKITQNYLSEKKYSNGKCVNIVFFDYNTILLQPISYNRNCGIERLNIKGETIELISYPDELLNHKSEILLAIHKKFYFLIGKRGNTLYAIDRERKITYEIDGIKNNETIESEIQWFRICDEYILIQLDGMLFIYKIELENIF